MDEVEIVDETSPQLAYLASMSEDLLARADVELVVGGETLPCHYPIVALHSKVFDKILADTLPRSNIDAATEGRAAKRRRCDAPGESESLGVGQSVGGRVRLEEPLRGKSLQAVQGMLEWMYSASKDVKFDEKLCFDLLALAHEYDIPALSDSLIRFLLPGLAPRRKDVSGNAMPPNGPHARSSSAAIIWLRHCEQFNVDNYKKQCQAVIQEDFHALLGTHHNQLALLDAGCLLDFAKTTLGRSKASSEAENQKLLSELTTYRRRGW